jgi:hypothetical protein
VNDPEQLQCGVEEGNGVTPTKNIPSKASIESLSCPTMFDQLTEVICSTTVTCHAKNVF